MKLKYVICNKMNPSDIETPQRSGSIAWRSGFWGVPKIHLLELKRRQTTAWRPSRRKRGRAWQGDRPVCLHLSPSRCRPCIDTGRHKQLLNIPPRSPCLIPSVSHCPPGRVDKRDGTFPAEDMNHYASSFRDRSHAHWFYQLNWLY